MHFFVETFLNVLFPPSCGFCGKLDNNYICNTCLAKYSLLKQSKTLNYFNNSQNHFNFQEHFYLFDYKSEVRNYIIQYKFNEKSYLYKTFVKLFVDDVAFANFIKKYDIITCVPLSKKRFKSRGYNQSGLIAKEIAKHFNICYIDNLLIKNKNIVAQSSLNKKERQFNIQNAFSLNHNLTLNFNYFNSKTKKPLDFFSNGLKTNNNLKIAIFDDIFTTGATSNECAKVLSSLNPSKIGVITLAKD